MLGFSRTRAQLEEAITTLVDAMVSEALLGGASTGLKWREPPAVPEE